MGCLAEKLFFKRGIDKVSNSNIPIELWSCTINDIDGNLRKLSEFTINKKAFIFVNVACKWGLTSDHYTELVELYKKYSESGLQILAFPSGQFMNQELGTEKEIKEFVSDKFKVGFPMFSKIEVNGENMHNIYKYLKLNTSELNTKDGLKNIPWNFAKFLVNSEGKIVGFYSPKIKPFELEDEIKKLLI